MDHGSLIVGIIAAIGTPLTGYWAYRKAHLDAAVTRETLLQQQANQLREEIRTDRDADRQERQSARQENMSLRTRLDEVEEKFDAFRRDSWARENDYQARLTRLLTSVTYWMEHALRGHHISDFPDHPRGGDLDALNDAAYAQPKPSTIEEKQ